MFREARFEPKEFEIEADVPEARVRVIEAEDGELVTGESIATLATQDGVLQADPENDVLLVAVCNRYTPAPPAVAFIRGFGLRRGAIASSVAHDSHQVIAVGTSPAAVATAVNAVFERRGGLVAIDGDRSAGLSLPIAGLMSDRPAEEVAAGYEAVSAVARNLGSNLQAPFMTLSFMALLVIPSLKIGDRGLFDGSAFAFTSVRV
ncbi:MAG: adenine deaminase C-terminal domain-containing protein [Planctomycetota bacterium]